MTRVQTEFVGREAPFQTHPRLGEMLTKVWDHVLASLDGKSNRRSGYERRQRRRHRDSASEVLIDSGRAVTPASAYPR